MPFTTHAIAYAFGIAIALVVVYVAVRVAYLMLSGVDKDEQPWSD